MADLDLSLSDALTDSVPQSGTENMVQRDFVAALEAETFEDQVGETVGKTDYIPLLDKDEKRDAGSAVTPGGQVAAQRPEPQGEVRPRSTGQQVFSTDFMSGPVTMSGFGDQWDTQPFTPQMQDNSLMSAHPGYCCFSQPGMMKMEVGVAPLQTERTPSIAEPQKPPASLATEGLAPASPASAAGVLVDPWEGEGGLRTDLPFTPSVSTVISRHASQLAGSPQEPPDPQWGHRQGPGAGEERENEAADRKQQKKKKKRRPREEVYDLLETRGPADPHGPQAENTPPTDAPHRVSPRREGGWEREDGGRSGGRGKRGKSRKKVPEEWGVPQEPLVSPPGSRPQEVAADPLTPPLACPQAAESPAHDMRDPLVCLSGDSPSFSLEDGLIPGVPPSLTQDLLSLTASFPPPTLGSEPVLISPIAMSPGLGAGSSPKQTLLQPLGLETPFSVGVVDSPVAPCVVAGVPSMEKAEEGLSLLPSDLFGADTSVSADKEELPYSPEGVQAESEPIEKAVPVLEPSFISSVKESHEEDVVVPSIPSPPKEAPVASLTALHPGSPTGEAIPTPSSSETPSEDTIDPSTGSPLTPTEGAFPPQDAPFTPLHYEEPTSPGGKAGPGPTLPEEHPQDTSALSPVSSPKDKPLSSPKELKEARGQKQKQPKKSRSASAKSPTTPEAKQPPSVTPPALSPVTPSAPPLFSLNSELNPSAPPFFPNFPENQEHPVQGGEDEGGLADPLALEVVKTEKEGKLDKVERMDNSQKVENFDMFDKKDKTEKTDMMEKTDKAESVGKQEKEKVDKVEKVDTLEKVEKTEKAEKTDKQEKMDKAEKTDKLEKEEKAQKMEKDEKVDKVEKAEKDEKVDKVEKTEKDQKVDKDKVEKTEKDQKVEKDKVEKKEKDEKVDKDKVEKAEKDEKAAKVEKAEKDEKVDKDKAEKETQDKAQKAEKPEKKDAAEKTDKATKPGDKPEKTGKVAGKSPAANGISAAPTKDLTSPDKKTKPAAGSAKPSSAKPRPSSLSTGSAAPKRPTPTSNSSSTAPSKKSPIPKATTPTTGTKRPPSAASRPPTTTATSREVKPKTAEARTTERRPPVPKANATGTTPAATSKNGSSATDTTKPAGAPRVPLASRTSTSAPTPRRSTAAKTDSKPGEVKKSSTLKTTPADSTRPRTNPSRSPATISSSLVASTAATRARAAKPSTPSVPEKKPPVPRAPRPSAAPAKASSRPGTAPLPDIRNIRSKIGSTDNMKHQPGGGKVSAAQGRTDTLAQGSLSKETSQGKVQIVNKKLDFSHVTSRLGSKDNIKHVPGGGNVQIMNKKVDVSKVTSKCGSKVNIKHKPGGGDVKIESHKVNFKDKAQSKVGSMDNVSHEPGGGHIKAEGAQETAEGNVAPSSGDPAPVPAGRAAQENGVKEGAPCGEGEGLRDPQGLDSRIPETSI
ncbi:microtubule-associated protein 4 [Megalops cyprinoides]|uniref:microtubule-associated protein 4 n=1 Tax=Megalops cyprinoides TaxID=118141 RepID=UPI0018643096|nr:microtubule-associated protein 4 [Megalops cyprinoides]